MWKLSSSVVPWFLSSPHPVFLSRNSRDPSIKSRDSIEYYFELEVIKLSEWSDNKQIK